MHLREEQSCPISSRSDLKRRSLRLFKERRHNKKMNNNNNNKISSYRPIWDQFLVQKAAEAVLVVLSQSHVLYIVDKPFQNALKCTILKAKVQTFSGRGHSLLPRPHPRWGGGIPPHLHRGLWPLTHLDPPSCKNLAPPLSVTLCIVALRICVHS